MAFNFSTFLRFGEKSKKLLDISSKIFVKKGFKPWMFSYYCKMATSWSSGGLVKIYNKSPMKNEFRFYTEGKCDKI